ncbi:MAG: hypothetical protein IPL18_13025 [Sphingomonadales bacterium]|nr:hypothetical protein [Sphingomonadales bacterium]
MKSPLLGKTFPHSKVYCPPRMHGEEVPCSGGSTGGHEGSPWSGMQRGRRTLARRAVIPLHGLHLLLLLNTEFVAMSQGWSDHDRKRECFGSVCIRAYADRYVFLANISFGTVNVQGTKTAVGVVRLSQYFACSAADKELAVDRPATLESIAHDGTWPILAMWQILNFHSFEPKSARSIAGPSSR